MTGSTQSQDAARSATSAGSKWPRSIAGRRYRPASQRSLEPPVPQATGQGYQMLMIRFTFAMAREGGEISGQEAQAQHSAVVLRGCGVQARTVGISSQRVVNRGERRSCLVDQLLPAPPVPAIDALPMCTEPRP